jgi:hypothetical protein
MSISFLLDEKPTVVLISSVGERSGRDDRQVRRYNQGSARCRYRTMSPQKGFNSATALSLTLFVTNAEAMESVVYSSRKTAFVEGRNGQFGVGLN